MYIYIYIYIYIQLDPCYNTLLESTTCWLYYRLHTTVYFITVPSNCLIISWLKHKCYPQHFVENKMFLQNWAKSNRIGDIHVVQMKVTTIWTNKWTFIGACAQINVHENIVVFVSAFCNEMSNVIEQFYRT